ncbi:MAG TPA: hypothetical protein PKD70_06280 [Saprospiraceae bacterium]|nr:hypothetical protein [Saprospiraceae bacterium]HMP13465.1 hypothetical protein [Saprospiraceae bacterium]
MRQTFLFFLFLFSFYAALAQPRYVIAEQPLCWTVNGQDSSITRYLLITSQGALDSVIVLDQYGANVNITAGTLALGHCDCCGGSGGDSGVNIYNSSGALAGNRLVDGANFNLQLFSIDTMLLRNAHFFLGNPQNTIKYTTYDGTDGQVLSYDAAGDSTKWITVSATPTGTANRTARFNSAGVLQASTLLFDDSTRVSVNTNGLLRLGPRAAVPGAPLSGDLWYRSDLGVLQYYDGVAAVPRILGEQLWQRIGGGNNIQYNSGGVIVNNTAAYNNTKLRVTNDATALNDYSLLVEVSNATVWAGGLGIFQQDYTTRPFGWVITSTGGASAATELLFGIKDKASGAMASSRRPLQLALDRVQITGNGASTHGLVINNGSLIHDNQGVFSVQSQANVWHFDLDYNNNDPDGYFEFKANASAQDSNIIMRAYETIRGVTIGSGNAAPPSKGLLVGGQLYVKAVTGTADVDINGTFGYNQLRLRTTYTPTSTSDTNGNTGDFSWDANFIYVKTATGWKRTALSTF